MKRRKKTAGLRPASVTTGSRTQEARREVSWPEERKSNGAVSGRAKEQLTGKQQEVRVGRSVRKGLQEKTR